MKLTYFDINGGRGEAPRLAMLMGGIEFEDDRLPFPVFREKRKSFPFYRVPTLEVDGKLLTQSNSILRFVGKRAGLYPEDPMQAALCDEVMESVEDCATAAVATFSIADEDEKKAAREALIEFPLSIYLKRLSNMLESRGEFFADDRLTVADLKVFVWVSGLRRGVLDYVPNDVVETHGPQVAKHADRIGAIEKIATYYANASD